VGITGLDDSAKRQLQDTIDEFFAGLNSQAIEFPGSTFSRALAAKKRLFKMLQPRLAEQRDALLAEGSIISGDSSAANSTKKPRCVARRVELP